VSDVAAADGGEGVEESDGPGPHDGLRDELIALVEVKSKSFWKLELQGAAALSRSPPL
jgi:hypothetical protein